MKWSTTVSGGTLDVDEPVVVEHGDDPLSLEG